MATWGRARAETEELVTGGAGEPEVTSSTLGKMTRSKLLLNNKEPIFGEQEYNSLSKAGSKVHCYFITKWLTKRLLYFSP